MKINHLFTETKQTHRALALLFWLAMMICALLLLGLQVAKPAYAAITSTVNSTDDAGDVVTNGTCDSDASTAGEQCTLRAAIQEANATEDADPINFNIPSTDCDATSGVCTIQRR